MSDTVAGDEFDGARPGSRVLVIAWATLVALVLAVVATVAFLGNPHAGDPKVWVDLKTVARRLKLGPMLVRADSLCRRPDRASYRIAVIRLSRLRRPATAIPPTADLPAPLAASSSA